uniref:Uncharacterized protein n=1 Tax=Anopheles farauti TaxID=69004 RepID=A0A182QLT1_9DIPT
MSWGPPAFGQGSPPPLSLLLPWVALPLPPHVLEEGAAPVAATGEDDDDEDVTTVVSCICRRRMRFIFFSFSVSMRYVAAVSFSRGFDVVEVSVSSELSDTLRGPTLPLPIASSTVTSTRGPPSTSVASASLTSVRQLSLVVPEWIVPPLSSDFCEWAGGSAFFSGCFDGDGTITVTPISSWWLLLPVLLLLLLLLLFATLARCGFARPWISGRSGDSSAYGMFSPSVSGRDARPMWLHCWCSEWRPVPPYPPPPPPLRSPSLSSAWSRSESMEESRSERSLLSSAIVTVFSDMEPGRFE